MWVAPYVLLFTITASSADYADCFKKDRRVVSIGGRYNTVKGTGSAVQCQAECAATEGEEACHSFTYYGDSKECWLAHEAASYEVVDVVHEALAGPRECRAADELTEAAEETLPASAAAHLVDAAGGNAGDVAAPAAAAGLVGAGLVGAAGGSTEGASKNGESSSTALDSLASSSPGQSIESSSLPNYGWFLLILGLLSLLLCGALANMAKRKPKKRAKKQPSAAAAEAGAPLVAAPVVSSISVPYAQPQVVQYAQPVQTVQTVQYAQPVQSVAQPQVVEYVQQQPQVVEYVQPVVQPTFVTTPRAA